MRLDAYLAKAAPGVTQKAAGVLIRDGSVSVSDVVTTDPSYQVILGAGETVRIKGRAEPLREPFHRLLLMNKPAGYVCERPRGSEGWLEARGRLKEAPVATSDALPPDVYRLLSDKVCHPSLGVFGRLDRDTTGALLIGSDGGLQTLLTHPSSNIKKVYTAQLDPKFPLSPTAVHDFDKGVILSNNMVCEPAQLEVLEVQPLPDTDKSCKGIACMETTYGGTPTKVRVTLHEGKYHQVKRMLAAVGACVAQLHRQSIGSGAISVDGLPLAGVREVTPSELRSVSNLLPAELRGNQQRRGERGTSKKQRTHSDNL